MIEAVAEQLLLQRFRVLEARRADIDGDDARAGMTECEFRGLPRSASGNEDIEVSAIFLVGPKQVKLGAVDIQVLPHIASAIEVLKRRWVGMTGVKLAYRICDSFRFHEFFRVFRVRG